ncbi:hypothetical protein [Bradyrhizobium sp. CCBAU 21360]|uniref:hypothetical protein n=1 Tax=Bradyrhizobium sp. CCBAU 21360 TaxID=1325081 RepID=UPI002305AA95|nr:hypothetical protein [Bradyrhizobium sp. CCBAU 21360]MDA9451092.1 hypothetical protein [Bradyrhizobium sp. CCBAU 21360]
MLSFFVVNLLIPNDPDTLELDTPSGKWELSKFPNFANSKAAIAQGQCAHTYIIENPIPLVPAVASDAAFEELTPILLGASYATGLAVTIRNQTLGSDVSIMGPSDHWPRDRAIAMASPVVTSPEEFKQFVESFVAAWPNAGRL